MSDSNEKLGLGWLPDYPDFRDYSENSQGNKRSVHHGKSSEKSCQDAVVG